MTHPSPTPVIGGSAVAVPSAAPASDKPLAPPQIEELLRQMNRAIRTRQLYLPNNPTYRKALESVGVVFQKLWAELPELELEITESEFLWQDIPVGREEAKSDSLSWLLYKDGMRSITLLPGFEREELHLLTDILTRVRKAHPEEDDLLTLLWEQEFVHFQYQFVDLTLDETPGIEADRSTATRTTTAPAQMEESGPPRPGLVRMEDFDSTLYFLDEHEVEYLKSHIQAEYASDLRRNVVAMLFDIFEVEKSTAVREEICGILERTMLHLVEMEELGAVAYLLREGRVVAERAEELEAAHRNRLLRLADTLSEPATLERLLGVLDASSAVPPQEDLDALFAQLRPGSLGTLLSWMGKLENARLRTALDAVANTLAGANVSELVRLILSPDGVVALEAARRAGQIKTAAAAGPLGRALTAPARELRLAAVQALAEIGSPGALGNLVQAIDDSDRDVRVTAVRALGSRGYAAALPKIEAIVTGKDVRAADLSEKMAVFEAFSALARENGTELLVEMLNGRRSFRRRLDPELRACAAFALGQIGTKEALEALQHASADKEALVSNAVRKALRGPQ